MRLWWSVLGVSSGIYLLTVFGLGIYVNVDQNEPVYMQLYNYWILYGTIALAMLFSVVMLVWQKGEKDLDVFVKKGLLMPIAFFVSLTLVSFMLPHSYHIELTYMGEAVSIFDYDNLQSGTSGRYERYAPSEVVMQVSLYAFIAIGLASLLRLGWNKKVG